MATKKAKQENIYVKIGENIKKLRLKNDLSQEELAFRIESARNYIGCIERGEKRARVITLDKIAKALNVSLADIFKNC